MLTALVLVLLFFPVMMMLSPRMTPFSALGRRFGVRTLVFATVRVLVEVVVVCVLAACL